MKTRETRIASLFMTMLIIGMFAVVPAMACVPGEPSGCEGSLTNAEETNLIEIIGADKENFYNIAVKNERVNEVKSDLSEQGFKEANFEAYAKVITLDDGSILETQFGVIEFESSEETKELFYIYDQETGENLVLLASETNLDLNEMKIGATNKKEYKTTEVNVYDLFKVKPNKLPVPLLRYNNLNTDMKTDIQSIADKANIKSEDEIVGMLEYNNQKIVLVDSDNEVTEIVTDEQGNIIATYQLEPTFVGSTEYMNEEANIPLKTTVDLYKLDITVPDSKGSPVQTLTTNIITAENSAWKEIVCEPCKYTSKDMNVVAKGKFYIDYGNEVESVTQMSYSETNCNICISKCSFERSTSGGSYERQVDATGIWAVNLAPVTANFEISSWVSVDKYGDMDSGASEDSWLTPGFGCYGP
ncbi:hypothetical protein J2755_000528 [Methanohalophilus levihalophilus]|uniref:hypothetical protein n=1 Tax=Methanohalophilus levihalophilus TaxID=1431282 RepID=UPI001AE850E5|nr:hypothetical protein [Methanohalophilus levihalophilus]MBP2029608.1 hypothetical protein [Methanohalophilus levihalophilus]